MKLYSYCIPVDDGAAPNPFWGVCTLVICKPVIRRIAEEGDWVVGVGSKNVNGKDYSGKLVYAMRVSQKMSLSKYDKYCKMMQPKKIPDIKSEDYRRRVGDCIYDYDGGYDPVLLPSVHMKENTGRDLRGENALLSDEFYYFGNQAIEIPEQFSVLARQGQGHQSTRNQFIKEDFVQWIRSTYEKNKLYGDPQIEIKFQESGNRELCASLRCDSANEDEAFDYSDEKLPLDHWPYFLALESDLRTLSRYIELHEQNFKTFSIGITQLFLAACSEIDVILKRISYLITGNEPRNMEGYSKAILGRFPEIVKSEVSIPIYELKITPFANWTTKSPPVWWNAYNNVKHHRNRHYMDANLGNTLSALGALYISIFEYIRIHKGKPSGGFSANLIFRHLQPKQELFLLNGENIWRDIAEGKKNVFGK